MEILESVVSVGLGFAPTFAGLYLAGVYFRDTRSVMATESPSGYARKGVKSSLEKRAPIAMFREGTV